MEKERLSKENIKTIKDLINYFGIDEKFIEDNGLYIQFICCFLRSGLLFDIAYTDWASLTVSIKKIG